MLSAGDFRANRPTPSWPRHRPGQWTVLGAVGCLLIVVPGCMLYHKHYVDRQTTGTYAAIHPTAAPRLVKIDVEFQRNGRRAWFLAPKLRPKVVRQLTATRQFVEADSTNEAYAGQLKVVVDQQTTLSEYAAAAGKGAIAGLTYWMVSPEWTQRYEIRVEYSPPDGEAIICKYQSTYRLKFGLDAALSDREPVPMFEVFDELIEGPLVSFICDYQARERGTAIAMAPRASAASRSPVADPEFAVPAGANVPFPPAGQTQWLEPPPFTGVR